MARTTWTVDAAHADVQFSAKHMMVTSVRGKFTEVAGSVELDETDLTTASGTFSVRTASIATGVDARDNHLRSADFFDAERFPEITFASTGITAKGGSDYAVTGDLTIRDVTRPITFDAEFLGTYVGMNGARRLGVHATTKLDREAWGLTWNVALESGGWLVGKEIRLEIDLALEEAAAVTTRDEAPIAA